MCVCVRVAAERSVQKRFCDCLRDFFACVVQFVVVSLLANTPLLVSSSLIGKTDFRNVGFVELWELYWSQLLCCDILVFQAFSG